MKKRVVILRGLPGSGKSTYARQNFDEAKVVSADDFFVGADGVYRFNPALIGEAHGACCRRFIEALQAGETLVVVDNTATTVAEIAPYVLIAQAYGYETEIITVSCDPAVAAARNVHGVPATAVASMAKQIKVGTAGLMPWWKHRVVKVG